MEQNELSEQSANRPMDVREALATTPSPANRAGAVLVPQQNGGTCNTCNGATGSELERLGTAASYVYAVGQIEVRFPSLSVEKEFAQATGRAETVGLTDRQAVQNVLSARPNRYLARQVCWVFTIEGLETYILIPQDPLDYDVLIEAVRPTPRRTDIDVVIGIRGPMAPPEVCNGLTIPVVAFDQIYSFDTDSFINEISAAIGGGQEQGEEEGGGKRRRRRNAGQEGETRPDVQATAEDLFNRIVQVTDNAGATDEHRALNYLATRYPEIYRLTSERFGEDFSLTDVSVQPSRLSGVRKIVTVTFTFSPRAGATPVAYGVEQYFVRVDVTEKFPFLVSPLQRGFSR